MHTAACHLSHLSTTSRVVLCAIIGSQLLGNVNFLGKEDIFSLSLLPFVNIFDFVHSGSLITVVA